MNDLNDFTKTLNILYVEDEISAREISTKIFKRFFNTVEAKENGLEGYLAFKEKYLNNERYDLIISDINMPKLDGVEMLQKIREIDTNVPVILITARHESDILLKAIELQVSSFIIKPLSIDFITSVIDKTCEKLFLKSVLVKKSRELELYIKTVEQIAFIMKMDLNLNITYMNSLLCDSLGCTMKDAMGQSLDFFKSKLSGDNMFKNLEETLSNGHSWESKIKIERNNDEDIFLKSTITQIYDNSNKNILEYAFIAYAITDQENERKEQNKKMFQNIAYLKKEKFNDVLENQNQKKEIEELKIYINNLNAQIENVNKSKSNLLNQLEAYEVSSLNQSTGKVDLLRKKNEEIEILRKSLLKQKAEKDLLIVKINDQNDTIEHKDNLMDLFNKKEIKLNMRIKGLEDVINDLENNGSGNKKGNILENTLSKLL